MPRRTTIDDPTPAAPLRLILVFLLPFAIGATGCSAPSRPEFRALDNVKFRGAHSDKVIRLSADALFFNPNAVDLEITGVDLQLTLDGEHAADIREAGVSTLLAGCRCVSGCSRFQIRRAPSPSDCSTWRPWTGSQEVRPKRPLRAAGWPVAGKAP